MHSATNRTTDCKKVSEEQRTTIIVWRILCDALKLEWDRIPAKLLHLDGIMKVLALCRRRRRRRHRCRLYFPHCCAANFTQ